MKFDRLDSIIDKGLQKHSAVFLTILGVVSIIFGIVFMWLNFDIGFGSAVVGIILVIIAHILGYKG